jgi:hypothetical protein
VANPGRTAHDYLQAGPVRHTLSLHTDHGRDADGQSARLEFGPGEAASPPVPVLRVHPTAFCYSGDAEPAAPGGMAAIYRDLVADDARTAQVADDVHAALNRGRHCLVLTQWTGHLDKITGALRHRGHDPVVLRGGMGAKAAPPHWPACSLRPASRRCLSSPPGPTPAKASTAPYWTPCSSRPPIAFKGRLVQYAGRILRTHAGKTTAEIHDYHDTGTGVLAASLAKRAPGYTSLGFPDPRRLPLTPSHGP